MPGESTRKKKKRSVKDGSAASKGQEGTSSDPRFTRMHTDPRFQRLPQKKNRLAVDSRFADMFTNKDFNPNAEKVDKYGRRVEGKKGNELKQYYRLSDSGDEEDGEGEEDVFDPARGIGVMMSSSDSSSDGEAGDEESDGAEEAQAHSGDAEAGGEGESMATSRIAVQNCDWDHVKAVDLLVLMQSFVPSGGSILKVTVYPSDFGMKRMAEEEVNGPGDVWEDKEVAEERRRKKGKKKGKGDEDDEGTGIDLDKLRQYQLDRMKYYYAIVECDTVHTARKVYEQVDGMEYERSSNLMDLRYVPDGMDFENPPRETATSIPDDYEPDEFYTKAQQHTKVELEWDKPDPKRTKLLMRKPTKDEINEMDLKDYVASASDSGSDAAERYRQLLTGGGDEEGEGDEGEEMEITFNTGLRGKMEELVKKKQEGEKEKDESVWEKYLREKRAKQKKRRREKAAAEDEEGSESSDIGAPRGGKPGKKGKKKKKTAEEEAEEEARERAELELLMLDEDPDAAKGFNYRDVQDAAKKKKRKKKKKDVVEDNFEMDVEDPRFKSLDNPDFFIDRTNPMYKKTEGMEKLVQHTSRKRAMQEDDVPAEGPKKKKKKKSRSGDGGSSVPEAAESKSVSLKSLVNSVKGKNQRLKAGAK